MLDLGDFPQVLPQTFRWRIAAPPTLWLQSCNIANAKGVGRVTKKLLENEGAIGEPAPFISLSSHPNSFLNTETRANGRLSLRDAIVGRRTRRVVPTIG